MEDKLLDGLGYCLHSMQVFLVASYIVFTSLKESNVFLIMHVVCLLQILTTLVEGLSIPVTCKIRVLHEVSFSLSALLLLCPTTKTQTQGLLRTK